VRNASSWFTLARSRNKEFLRFAPPGHFYSPIPDLDMARRNASRVFDSSVDDVPAVRLNEDAQVMLLSRFAGHHGEMPFPERPSNRSRYHLDNQWFGYGDGVTLYSMMREFTPARIVEVGSGYSSAAMLDVDERFFGAIDLTFIDPYPQRLLGLLGQADRDRCIVHQQAVQDVPIEVFTQLGAGDFLFIDSSHLAKTDSDVLHLLSRVLPVLQPGVIVHIHDILWPFEYPASWLEQGRAWNEAYFVRAFLQFNDTFDILYFNSYMERKHADLVRAAMPLAMSVPSMENTIGNSSLWLRKN
jgi:predicted O-methyltransferase YrrM